MVLFMQHQTSKIRLSNNPPWSTRGGGNHLTTFSSAYFIYFRFRYRSVLHYSWIFILLVYFDGKISHPAPLTITIYTLFWPKLDKNHPNWTFHCPISRHSLQIAFSKLVFWNPRLKIHLWCKFQTNWIKIWKIWFFHTFFAKFDQIC